MPGKNCLLHFQTLHTEAHGGKFMPDIEWYASQGSAQLPSPLRVHIPIQGPGAVWPWPRAPWLNYGIFSLLFPPFIFALRTEDGIELCCDVITLCLGSPKRKRILWGGDFFKVFVVDVVKGGNQQRKRVIELQSGLIYFSEIKTLFWHWFRYIKKV